MQSYFRITINVEFSDTIFVRFIDINNISAEFLNSRLKAYNLTLEGLTLCICDYDLIKVRSNNDSALKQIAFD